MLARPSLTLLLNSVCNCSRYLVIWLKVTRLSLPSPMASMAYLVSSTMLESWLVMEVLPKRLSRLLEEELLEPLEVEPFNCWPCHWNSTLL